MSFDFWAFVLIVFEVISDEVVGAYVVMGLFCEFLCNCMSEIVE